MLPVARNSAAAECTRLASVNSTAVEKPLAWVISDKAGLRQSLLQSLGFATTNFHHDLHSKSHYNRMMQGLVLEQPAVLWLRFAGPCAGSGNKQDAARTAHLCSVLQAQQSAGRIAVVEANARSQIWNFQVVRAMLTNLNMSEHSWCCYENKLKSGFIRCNSIVKLATNFALENKTCTCDPSLRHVDSKQLGKERDDRWSNVLAGIVHRALSMSSNSDSGLHRQPELKGLDKTPNPAQARVSRHQPDEFPKHKKSSLVSVEQHLGKHAVVEEVSFALPVSQPSADLHFPTEEAERRKVRLKAGHVIKPRKFEVEQCDDDLGNDLSSILESVECVSWSPELLGFEAERFDPLEDAECELRAFIVGRHRWMRGSSSNRPMLKLEQRGHFNMEQLLHATLPEDEISIDVLEIFGGDGTTTWLLCKKHGLKSGWNFDLTVGMDLTSECDIRLLWTFLKVKRPKVVILAPPCRSYGSLSCLNKVLHPDSWERHYTYDKTLVQLSSEIAAFQMRSGRHFVTEQPAASTMFKSREWTMFMGNLPVHECVFDQCMVGLKSHTSGLPVKKPTRLVSSSALILSRFQGLRCKNHPEHAAITTLANASHSVASTGVQVWPIGLCNRLADGIVDCIMSEAHISESYAAKVRNSGQCPGCKWHKRRDHPSHDRSANCKFPDDERSKWKCPACLRNKPRKDSSHTLDHECQWGVARVMPEGLGRERKGAHPRDGRIPASTEPTAALGQPPAEPAETDARPQLRGTGSREAHVEDVEALRARRAEQAAIDVPRIKKRDSATQVTEGGTGARADVALDPADVEVQVEARPSAPPHDEAEPDHDPNRWTSFDLGRALLDLRSVREGVVRRALRKLHIRWFHASAGRMKTLLTAAGVPKEILVLVHQIVDTCDICRAWAKPGPKTVTSSSVTARFNQEVQLDLLFYEDKVVLHMLDKTTRFTVAKRLVSKGLDDIIEGIMSSWLALFGPPSKIVSDQEGALSSPEAAAFLESRGIKLHLLAKEQHAAVVERHHAILRRQMHVLEDQTLAEGIRMSFDSLLSESCFAKNALFAIGGATPYEAVFGRTPALLGVVDAEVGDSPDDRDSDRVRQLAIQSMVQSMAENKIRRATRGKSRAAGELLNLQVGEQVEFYRKASTKDSQSWYGPATVVDLTSIRDGQLGLKWQGRLIICRTQDVRRALLFCSFLSQLATETPVTHVCRAAEDLRGEAVRLGWFKSKDSWIACEGNHRFPRVLIAGLHVGSCALNLYGIVSFRLGSCVTSLPAISCDDSFLLWWTPGDVSCWYHAYLAGNQHLNLQKITMKQEAAFIQYFLEDTETVASLRQVVVDIPNVGGPFEPSLPQLKDVTERVLQAQKRRQLALEDVSALPPTGPEAFDIFTPPATPNADESHQDTTTPKSDESPFQMFMFHVCHPPEVTVNVAPEPVFVFTPPELESEPPQIAFNSQSSVYLVLLAKHPQPDELILYDYNSEEAVIERVHNVLSRQEALQHADECRVSMLNELARWHKHKAWIRLSRDKASNVLSSKWVLKWKQIEGSKQIKSRLVVQGFKDTQEVRSYAGTTNRWAQRLVLALAVQMSWPVFSADISEAFLRGLSFQELFESGEDKVLRQVQLELPPGSQELLRTLPGMEDFDSQVEVLNMLKPGFGLRDAPRLWNRALQRVLKEIGLVGVQTDEQLYVRHQGSVLVLILSVHVDDLKISGHDPEIQRAIKILEQNFDALKLEKDDFEHLGLKHRLLPDGSRSVSQQHYVNELRPVADAELKLSQPDEAVCEETRAKFMSLLGGVAWTVQTRPDVAVFVSALQRRMKAPSAQDVLNLNRVLKYLKVKPLELRYRKIASPWSLVAISDSSFKGEDQDHLAVRSGIIALISRDGVKKGLNQLQLLEIVSKKQTKVCRSTFAAELHSGLEPIGLAMIINAALTEVLTGPRSAAQLVELQDSGKHALELSLMLDAKSVWSSAIGDEAKCMDQTVYLHLLKLRQLLGPVIRAIGWVDTRDMLSDGLTKGIVSRDLLRVVAAEGTWTVQHGLEIFRPTSKIATVKP